MSSSSDTANDNESLTSQQNNKKKDLIVNENTLNKNEEISASNESKCIKELPTETKESQQTNEKHKCIDKKSKNDTIEPSECGKTSENKSRTDSENSNSNITQDENMENKIQNIGENCYASRKRKSSIEDEISEISSNQANFNEDLSKTNEISETCLEENTLNDDSNKSVDSSGIYSEDLVNVDLCNSDLNKLTEMSEIVSNQNSFNEDLSKCNDISENCSEENSVNEDWEESIKSAAISSDRLNDNNNLNEDLRKTNEISNISPDETWFEDLKNLENKTHSDEEQHNTNKYFQIENDNVGSKTSPKNQKKSLDKLSKLTENNEDDNKEQFEKKNEKLNKENMVDINLTIHENMEEREVEKINSNENVIENISTTNAYSVPRFINNIANPKLDSKIMEYEENQINFQEKTPEKSTNNLSVNYLNLICNDNLENKIENEENSNIENITKIECNEDEQTIKGTKWNESPINTSEGDHLDCNISKNTSPEINLLVDNGNKINNLNQSNKIYDELKHDTLNTGNIKDISEPMLPVTDSITKNISTNNETKISLNNKLNDKELNNIQLIKENDEENNGSDENMNSTNSSVKDVENSEKCNTLPKSSSEINRLNDVFKRITQLQEEVKKPEDENKNIKIFSEAEKEELMKKYVKNEDSFVPKATFQQESEFSNNLDSSNSDETSALLENVTPINVISSSVTEIPDINNEPNIITQTGIDCEQNLLSRNVTSNDNTQENDQLINIEEHDKKLDEELKKQIKLYEINYKEYFKIGFSIFLFMVDVYSDTSLGAEYFANGRYVFAVLTLIFVITPSIVANVLLYEDTAEWRKAKRNIFFYIWIGPYIIFNFEPIVRYIKNIIYVKRYLKHQKECDVHAQIETHKKFVKGSCNVVAVKDWEAMLEAAPQLVLQLGIIIGDTEKEPLLSVTSLLQLVSLLTSSGLWFSQFSSHKAYIVSQGQLVSLTGACIFATARAMPLICRALAVGACMSTMPWVALSILGLHWIVVAIWWKLTGANNPTTFESAKNALLWVLTPFFRTIPEAIVVNSLMFLEDFLLLLMWLLKSEIEIRVPVIIAILVCDIIGRIMHCLYRKYMYSKFITTL